MKIWGTVFVDFSNISVASTSRSRITGAKIYTFSIVTYTAKLLFTELFDVLINPNNRKSFWCLGNYTLVMCFRANRVDLLFSSERQKDTAAFHATFVNKLKYMLWQAGSSFGTLDLICATGPGSEGTTRCLPWFSFIVLWCQGKKQQTKSYYYLPYFLYFIFFSVLIGVLF